MGTCRFLRVSSSSLDESSRWRHFSCRAWDRFRLLHARAVTECVSQSSVATTNTQQLQTTPKKTNITHLFSDETRMLNCIKKTVECYGYQIIKVLYTKKVKLILKNMVSKIECQRIKMEQNLFLKPLKNKLIEVLLDHTCI